jgi:hypothetical protein
MPDLDPTATNVAQGSGNADDDPDEDLAAAYEALAEDRRRQDEERAATQRSPDQQAMDGLEPASTSSPGDAVRSPEPVAGDTEVAADAATTKPEPAEASDGAAPEPAAPSNPATQPAGDPSRRVFVIDQKEYPDPDPELPITGARSVQAMYRDYFPGQLDNVDVVQKTRPDGTLEVTFKRRIGTKGRQLQSSRCRASTGWVS